MASRRMSLMSVATDVTAASRPVATGTLTSNNVMSSLNHVYNQAKAYQLDAGTSVVVNTWATAASGNGSTVDTSLAEKALQHAIRRAEDGCVVLASAHNSCPSTLSAFLNHFPVQLPETVFRALEAIQPFLRCVSVDNPSAFMHDALAVTMTMGLNERLLSVKIALSQTGIDTRKGLLEVPRETGNRAFDVFYYLLASVSSPAEREFLGLKPAAEYSLLNRTGTYDPPAYLPTADDSMAADDFRAALKDIGIKGEALRSLLTTLAALLKLGDTLDYIVDPEVLESTIEDVAGLLSIEPEVLVSQCSTEDRVRFAGGLYEALVDWVISKANAAIEASLAANADAANSDTVCLTVLDIPSPTIARGVCMRGIFDDSAGINAEMFQDGLDVTAASSAVVKETKEAAQETGAVLGKLSHEREIEQDMRERVLERIAWATPEEEFIRKLLFPTGTGVVLGKHERIDLKSVLESSRAWYQVSIHPVDGPSANLEVSSTRLPWVPGAISHQIRSWRLTEWGNRRNKHFDFTADFEFGEFVTRFAPLGCREGRDGIESWIMERGWSNGAVVVGNERVWMRENAWWEAETLRDVAIDGGALNPPTMPYGTGYSSGGSGYFGGLLPGQTPNASSDHLVHGLQRNLGHSNGSQVTLPQGMNSSAIQLTGLRGDYGLGNKGDRHKDQMYYNDDGDFTAAIDAEKAAGKTIETAPIDKGRRVWVAFVWALTFWIPSPLLSWVGRMRRPDVRMAWREKFVLVFLIFLMNAIIVFWIIAFGKLLCPNQDKAWNSQEVATHQGDDDFWVSIHGKVYDISKFWRIDHSDTAFAADQDSMQPLAGLDLDEYFVPPLTQSCPGLGISERTQLLVNVSNVPEYPSAVHTSGYYATDPTSALHADDWYYARFTPKIKEFYKGDLVWLQSEVEEDGNNNQHKWFIWDEKIYDLTNYFYTQKLQKGVATYQFLDSSIEDLINRNPGVDISDQITSLVDGANSTEVVKIKNSLNCIKNQFYVGIVDFRVSPRCQVNNYIMLAFTIIICAVILIKFLAALQFGSKRRPAAQDKFVICQVPAYTEGEDSLRKALDSLTGLSYDNKRKLICVICDGVIVGQGNDRPTPKIVLDILGVDPKLNPTALAFKSVGAGNEQLNYGKVYSGLYEYEGNVVPYLVVVKVGKESEQAKSKPGNRGKRDSQILLMSFLNRVHHRAPMNPLELEMFHQINNIIGVDPELYEYLLMVDADTSVAEDSLTRLVAACANDKKISGICGETSLENDEKSWWTMIQVYEYFISHHLAKAFESLFGSVTCLPGCFTMYRLRTADKGKPLIISDEVINDYSVCNVDTLHKKNLLSLGEDRYLTTLMTKHFPHMSNKFIAAAQCKTAAPESWSVLLSQRRRWINSTIHNLVELMRLKDMCGFCCFSMRFIVFIDLFGTIILPATCVYLGYLIYLMASNTGQFPLISIILLAAVYGLQALIFILKRQWQHIGWMIIYILAFPIYSFILPIYSFWNQDNFSWGNTRVVIGEKGDKKVVAVDGETFDPRSIPLQRWDDYALVNNLPGRRGGDMPPMYDQPMNENPFEKEGSIYSAAQGSFHHAGSMHMPPSPGYNAAFARQPSAYVNEQSAPMMHRRSMASMGGMTAMGGYQDIPRGPSPYQDYPHAATGSMSNLRNLGNMSPAVGAGLPMNRSSTALSNFGGARPTSGMDFQRGLATGPDDGTIIETIQQTMSSIDLDNVTKKQLRTLVEQRLQTTLSPERRSFVDAQIDIELQTMHG